LGVLLWGSVALGFFVLMEGRQVAGWFCVVMAGSFMALCSGACINGWVFVVGCLVLV